MTPSSLHLNTPCNWAQPEGLPSVWPGADRPLQSACVWSESASRLASRWAEPTRMRQAWPPTLPESTSHRNSP